MNNNTLGDTIRKLRKRLNLTQEELADGICSPVSISRIENGTQMPSHAVLNALLTRLGTGTYQLCDIYYRSDRELAFDAKASEVAELIQLGQYSAAKDALPSLKDFIADSNINKQYYLLLSATIQLQYLQQPDLALSSLYTALDLTKPNINLKDFRNLLLTVAEANILNLISVALLQTGKTLQAIHLAEELHDSLSRLQTTLKDYTILRINIAFNLAQYMERENRYHEALNYCIEAESLSLNSMEQLLLPEIEFIKAKAYHLLGNNEDCSAILKAIIPYMELINKHSFASLVRDYAHRELHLEL